MEFLVSWGELVKKKTSQAYLLYPKPAGDMQVPESARVSMTWLTGEFRRIIVQ